jgi:hypothetical protein
LSFSSQIHISYDYLSPLYPIYIATHIPINPIDSPCLLDTSAFVMVESTFLLILIDCIPKHFLASFTHRIFLSFFMTKSPLLLLVIYISLCCLCPIIHRPRYIAARCVQVSWSTALPRVVERFFGTSRRRRGGLAPGWRPPRVSILKKIIVPRITLLGSTHHIKTDLYT